MNKLKPKIYLLKCINKRNVKSDKEFSNDLKKYKNRVKVKCKRANNDLANKRKEIDHSLALSLNRKLDRINADHEEAMLEDFERDENISYLAEKYQIC